MLETNWITTRHTAPQINLLRALEEGSEPEPLHASDGAPENAAVPVVKPEPVPAVLAVAVPEPEPEILQIAAPKPVPAAAAIVVAPKPPLPVAPSEPALLAAGTVAKKPAAAAMNPHHPAARTRVRARDRRMSAPPWAEPPRKGGPADAKAAPDAALVRTPEEWFHAGITCLRKNRVFEASLAFRQAFELDPVNPEIMSYFGLTLALGKQQGKEGVRLCEEAVRRDGFRVELLHNLGRVYLLSGRKRKAHMAFLRGKALDRQNRAILRELDAMGHRREPVVPFLPRNHPVNRVAGVTLTRLGLR